MEKTHDTVELVVHNNQLPLLQYRVHEVNKHVQDLGGAVVCWSRTDQKTADTQTVELVVENWLQPNMEKSGLSCTVPWELLTTYHTDESMLVSMEHCVPLDEDLFLCKACGQKQETLCLLRLEGKIHIVCPMCVENVTHMRMPALQARAAWASLIRRMDEYASPDGPKAFDVRLLLHNAVNGLPHTQPMAPDYPDQEHGKRLQEYCQHEWAKAKTSIRGHLLEPYTHPFIMREHMTQLHRVVDLLKQNVRPNTNVWVGKPHERREFVFKLVWSKEGQNAYGMYAIVELVDMSGNHFLWRNSGKPLNRRAGEVFDARATIQQHLSQGGKRVTRLTRLVDLGTHSATQAPF